MWRALFMAVGVMLCIVGAECLFVEKAVLTEPSQIDALVYGVDAVKDAPRDISPPEWAPWSMISGGALILLYSISVKRPA